jgi:hypothetical protein
MMGSGVNIIRIYPHYNNNAFYGAANSGGLTVVTATGHFYAVSRTGASSSESYVDTAGTTDTSVSNSPPGALYLLADDSSPGTNPFQGIETFAYIGAGLTPTQEAALQSAYATYVASVP